MKIKRQYLTLLEILLVALLIGATLACVVESEISNKKVNELYKQLDMLNSENVRLSNQNNELILEKVRLKKENATLSCEIDNLVLKNKNLYNETEIIKSDISGFSGAFEVVKVKATAYAPLDNKSGICADNNPNVTSIGSEPRVGIIAVDPRKIPYGSEVYVDGFGWLRAEDTGGALRKYEGIQIDICMDSYEDAMSWGVQYIEVLIKREDG